MTTAFLIIPENLKQLRETIWSRLPAFDLQRALAGELFVHRYGLEKQRPTSGCYEVQTLRGPVYLVWSHEWLTYGGDGENDEAEMFSDFRMYDAAAWEGLGL